ncbi:ribonuclease activity regulator RraA [Parasalinivibrio latis]|uniref:ribonuclease activity regulator RraA n=1 Tax=Parasalinivibrio latis TaxID=2952610 RepID=UPI0030E0BAD3
MTNTAFKPEYVLTEETRQKLSGVATPTLHTLLLKRGYRNTYIQGVSRLNRRDIQMVGQAFTLRYIPAREDIDTVEAFKDPAHPQRVAVENVPAGKVLVSDCRQDASAASAGSILLARLQYRNCAGFVSDAGVRDAADASELDMPVFCAKPSAPTNLTKHHAVDINVPIGCGGVPVYPGDVLVGDGDGIIVIPQAIADDIAGEAVAMEKFEEYVKRRVEEGSAVIGLYPPNEETRAAYQSFLEQQDSSHQ